MAEFGMQDEPLGSPLERVTAALAGLRLDSLAEVLARDVVAVSESIPTARETEVTVCLGLGAARALEDAKPAHRARLLVYQYAGQLAELVRAASAPDAPAPTEESRDNALPEGV